MQIDWQPTPGDPTLVGWLTTFLYGAACVLSFRAAFITSRQSASNCGRRQWLLFGIVLFVLGLNKQLDLHRLAFQIARQFAITQGWYENRRPWQWTAFGVICVLVLIVSLTWLVRARDFSRNHPGAIAGMGLVLIYALLRLASFEHLEKLLGEGVGDWRLMPVLELLGLVLIGIAAAKPTGPKSTRA